MQIFLVWLRANRLRLFDVRHVLCHLCTLCSQLEIGFGFVFRFRFRIQILAKAFYQPVEQIYVAQHTYGQFKYKKKSNFIWTACQSAPANNWNLFGVLVFYCKSRRCLMPFPFGNGLCFCVSLLGDIHVMVYFASVCSNKFNVIDLEL